MKERLLSSDTTDGLPVWMAAKKDLKSLPDRPKRWAETSGFEAGFGQVLLVPGETGDLAGAVLGLGSGDADGKSGRRHGGQVDAFAVGKLAQALPAGDWRLAPMREIDERLAALAFLMGGYRFERYRSKAKPAREARFVAGNTVAIDEETAIAEAVALTRDLINTPANDMGPDALEQAARSLAGEFGGSTRVVRGGDLLEENFPMIHAVGRASAEAPRLIDITHGREDAPKVTLVGKGVCFDTGGLDIKPPAGMLLMKKDMSGAANVLGLARMIMALKIDVRLRVLIPAVENSIAGSAFRPGDILRSRKGKTVEIGNTDAEGRLVLADALALADEEAPQLLIDMASLTGAARVALGPELPPYYTDDDELAHAVDAMSEKVGDPLWRLPLWRAYEANLASKVADVNNITGDSFAGSVTAALFLSGFVEKARSWAHFDIYGWRPKASPIGPVGGEAQGIRAIFEVLSERYGRR